MFSDNIFDSGILQKERYTILYQPVNNSYIQKIYFKNPEIQLNGDNVVTWGVTGCNVDVKINHCYDVLFDIDNIENKFDIDSYIKHVFALGGIMFDQIPASWNVVATINFPEGIPTLIRNTLSQKRYCLSSAQLWEKLMMF